MREQSNRDHLARVVDEVLISGLPAGVKESIDDCLAKGGDPEVIRGIIARVAPEGSMTRFACEAYLEQRLKEGQ